MQAYLERELQAVLADMGAPADFQPEFETPANPEHGDLATNAAMQLARHLRRAPRKIAEEIAQRLRERPVDPQRVAAIEVAGPGFLNVRFSDAYLTGELAGLLAAGADYGRTSGGAGQRALVEYVSANPTGPLTVGHGRNAVLGDTVANLLEWTGHHVTREYYFNDAGRQMRVLGQSVRARYEALVFPDRPTKTIETGEGTSVEVPESFPDDGYLGAYITDVAQTLYDEHGDALAIAHPNGDVAPFKKPAEQTIFEEIRTTLARLGVRMDTFFNEHTLYETGAIERTLGGLREKGYVYEKDGAVWFKTTDFGKDSDTVLVKSSGEPTYRLPDIAYHASKFERGYDKMVDVFGADHIATYPDVLKGVEVLGYDPAKIDVVIYQFVTLVRGGEPVKMSTRKANFVTLDELMARWARTSPASSSSCARRTRIWSSISTSPRRPATKTPSSTSSTPTPASARSCARPRRSASPSPRRRTSACWSTRARPASSKSSCACPTCSPSPPTSRSPTAWLATSATWPWPFRSSTATAASSARSAR